MGMHFFDREELDAKVVNSVDAKLLHGTKIFAVGNGGANSVYENFLRLGIGQLTVIDFDHVSPSNLVTQGWYGDQIGISKVASLHEAAIRLSPNGKNDADVHRFLDDDFLAMSDEELEVLAGDANLLMFMTDDFFAQARGNRLALKLQKPAIFAMMYYRARCCEITFTIPGITPGCHRCAVSDRYKAYLEGGYENQIGSEGSLIFQTHAINSVLGMVALAIIHNERPGFEFGGWFGKNWDRNLLQLRLSPKYESNLFDRTFGGEPRVFNFDTIWQKIEPECPPKYEPCPDCGGIGDLRLVKIKDTHILKPRLNKAV